MKPEIEELRQLIDYYIAKSGDPLALIAILVSCFALTFTGYMFYRQQKNTKYTYLAGLWNEILDVYYQHPRFLDVTVTDNYEVRMEAQEKARYETFCCKVWGFVEDIVRQRFHKDIQYEPVINWLATYHLRWLERNPIFFKIERFWETVADVTRKPHAVVRYKSWPQKNGQIDWDTVAEHYHDYILGPFAPEMVVPAPDGCTRNLLLNELLSIPPGDLHRMDVGDFGCGPGNLLPHIGGRLRRITCVDTSPKALEIAQEKADASDVKLVVYCKDIRELGPDLKFDLILSSNSILPATRGEVIEMLRAIRKHLKPSGRLLAIMPSFDTTRYLKSLWYNHYVKTFRSKKQAERIAKALDLNKKVDEKACRYADDCTIAQCYHTPETIQKEFREAGLRILGELQKVYYPWDLTKRFDYGYFPGADEEIWDWYVVALRADAASGQGKASGQDG